MRCLALAQGSKDAGGRVSFVTACTNERLLKRLADEDFEIKRLKHSYPDSEDWAATQEVLSRSSGSWLVLDGYHFDSEYQKTIKSFGTPLLMIDDNAILPHYFADIVLNHNLHAANLRYSRERNTHVLSGPSYALLRREFQKWLDWERPTPERASKILITMGGADTENLTEKILHLLAKAKIGEIEVIVVIGPVYRYRNRIRKLLPDLPFRASVRTDVTDMTTLMAWADLAITGAGSTCWEALFMELPCILLILADNQREIAKSLDQDEFAIALDVIERNWEENLLHALERLRSDSLLRDNMSRRGRQAVDGFGVVRVLNYLNPPSLRLRPVSPDDCSLLWQWANDAQARAVSFHPNPIPWTSHTSWFESKLRDPYCLFFVGLNEAGSPIGQARFEVSANEAVISVSVAPESRRKGVGRDLIFLSSQKALRELGVSTIHAYVKVENQPSHQAFLKAGFVEKGTILVSGQKAWDLTLDRKYCT